MTHPPIIRLLKLIAPYKGWIALTALLGFATIGSSVGLMATSAYVIAKAALQPPISELQVAIVGVRFFGLSRGLFRYMERYTSHFVTFKLLARLRRWFYEAVEPLAPARLLTQRSGDLLSRVVADVETLENFYIRALAPPLTALLSISLLGLFVSWFDRSLTVGLIALLGLAGIGVPWLNYRLSRWASQQLIQQRADLNVTVLDGLQGMADLLAFGQAARHQQRLAQQSQAINLLQERLAAVRGLSQALIALLSSITALLMLWLAIPLVTTGQLNGLYLALLTLLALASFEAVIPLTEAAEHLESSLTAARRLFAIIDSQPEVAEMTVATPPIHPSPTPPYKLAIQGLSFSYPNHRPEIEPSHQPASVLHDIDLTLHDGERVAIVGPSGAGKSTLINLLLRFWAYRTGEIYLGEQPLSSYHPSAVRAMMGVVSQQTNLFNGSVRDNLLLASPQATHQQVEAALQQAQLQEFVQSLPDGMDSWIGEQGLRLSGGERQRMAIARAILKDAPMLLLDEPTANLDAVTERQVMQSLHQLMAHRTTLLITHRLVDMPLMDRILVLQQGHVVQQGRHAALLKEAGLYQSMWRLQHGVLG